MKVWKKIGDILLLIIYWITCFVAINFFGFIIVEIGGTFGQIAFNLFGGSVLLLLGIVTYKKIRSLCT